MHNVNSHDSSQDGLMQNAQIIELNQWECEGQNKTLFSSKDTYSIYAHMNACYVLCFIQVLSLHKNVKKEKEKRNRIKITQDGCGW